MDDRGDDMDWGNCEQTESQGNDSQVESEMTPDVTRSEWQ